MANHNKGTRKRWSEHEMNTCFHDYANGVTVANIAKMLARSEGAVYQMLHKNRKLNMKPRKQLWKKDK